MVASEDHKLNTPTTTPPSTQPQPLQEQEPTPITASTTTTNSHTTNQLIVPSLVLPISTPADSTLLGEVIIPQEQVEGIAENGQNGDAAFHLPPPSPRHDGVVLTEPTQWEQFADSIVKSHLDKSLRRGGGSGGVSGHGATATAEKEENNQTSEQNIEL